MPIESITVSSAPPLYVLSLRRAVSSFQDEGPLWSTLNKYLKDHSLTQTASRVAIHHSHKPTLDIEVCIPVATGTTTTNTTTTTTAAVVEDGESGAKKIKARALAGFDKAVVVRHVGTVMGLGDAHTELGKWLDENKGKYTRVGTEFWQIFHDYEEPFGEKSRTDIIVPLKESVA
ncbi:hypothetical protein BDZ88DRAFT_415272 [Geranomyces variabilis]|nr:hypothetical protein BDZ88DRAFT_415272 [Geranomyces variabilis]KAJ3137514.1 hypothetical protein HDU90_001917 [Geranomyces variabilis]